MFALIVTIAATFTSGALVLRLLPARLVDVPTVRSSHAQPTLRGGGLAIVAGTAAGLAAAGAAAELWMLFGLAGALSAVGLTDDLRGLSPVTRLASQVVLGVVAVSLLLDTPLSGVPWWLGVAATVFFVVGYVNAYNFMDGINGIAAAQLAVAGGSWWAIGAHLDATAVAGLGAVTLGAAIGFLPWNFPRARFFMGDVGSYFAGLWLAGGVVFAVEAGAPLVPALSPLALFGADTTFTLTARIARGERFWEPHRSHVYQRLSDHAGHTAVTLGYAVLSVLVVTAAATWLGDDPATRAVGTAAAGLVVLAYLALPALVGRSGVAGST